MVLWSSSKDSKDDHFATQKGIIINSPTPKNAGNHSLTVDRMKEGPSSIIFPQEIEQRLQRQIDENSNSMNTGLENVPLKPIPIDPELSKLHHQAIEAISEKNFDTLMDLVSNHPDIILYPCRKDDLNVKVHGAHGGTLLHVLVSDKPKLKYKISEKNSSKADKSQIPQVFILSPLMEHHLRQISTLKPQALWTVDDYGRLPLHCAVMTMAHHQQEIYATFSHETHKPQFINKLINRIEILLDLYPQATSTSDWKRNLPLHYAMNFPPDFDNHVQTSSGSSLLDNPAINRSLRHRKLSMSLNMTVEDIVFPLLDIFPVGMTKRNQCGDLPIHVLSSKGPMMNIVVLEIMLLFHCVKKISLTERNSAGDHPLHLAIKSDAPSDALRHFVSVQRILRTGDNLFEQRDANGLTPLQIALQAYKEPTSSSLVSMIVAMAPLTLTMPNSMGILPIHHATRLHLPDDIIQSMLEQDMPLELTSRDISLNNPGKITYRIHQHSWWHVAVDCKDQYINMSRKFLCQGATLLQVLHLSRQIGPDGSSILIHEASPNFRKMLRSLLTLYNRYEVLKSFSNGRENEFTLLAMDHGVIERAEDYEKQECRKIILRAYLYEDAFSAERSVRKQFHLSPDFIEKALKYHGEKNESPLKFSTNKSIYTISFERPFHTLEQVFTSVAPWERTGLWFTKCSVVIKQILLSLQHLHERHLVHGYMDPSSIGKYGNTWKLMNVGTATRVGNDMRGNLRSCAPPECISVYFKRKSKILHSPNRVQFEQSFSDDVDETYIESRHESCCFQEPLNFVVENYEGDSGSNLHFHPGKATTSWDVWGMGLIIVQLFLGPCPYLPNFDKSEDAHLRNLFHFDNNILQTICDLVADIDEDASDLVRRCLEPDPDKRAIVNDILGHRYFSTADPSICFF